jgi:hypothetical protein
MWLASCGLATPDTDPYKEIKIEMQAVGVKFLRSTEGKTGSSIIRN